MNEHDLRAALVDHEITYKGATYRAELVRIRTSPEWKADADAFDLDFTAAPVDRAGDPIRFELHVSQNTLNDRPYLLSAINETVIAILDGRLPPGARELL